MYQGFLHAHSFIAYGLLGAVVLAVVVALTGMGGKKPFAKPAGVFALVGMIAMHIQLLLGIGLYFISPMVQFSGSTMSNGTLRKFTLEHPLLMVIAVALVAIGRRKAKNLNEPGKSHRLIVIFYTLAIVAVLAAIPWNRWPSKQAAADAPAPTEQVDEAQ